MPQQIKSQESKKQKIFYPKGFVPINKLISQIAKQRHFQPALYRHQVLKYWQDIAPGFIEEAAEKTQALDFQKGILTVACLSREVAAKIRLLAQRIIEAINQFLGRQIIYAIYLEV